MSARAARPCRPGSRSESLAQTLALVVGELSQVVCAQELGTDAKTISRRLNGRPTLSCWPLDDVLMLADLELETLGTDRLATAVSAAFACAGQRDAQANPLAVAEGHQALMSAVGELLQVLALMPRGCCRPAHAALYDQLVTALKRVAVAGMDYARDFGAACGLTHIPLWRRCAGVTAASLALIACFVAGTPCRRPNARGGKRYQSALILEY